jgi:hypothetical protein
MNSDLVLKKQFEDVSSQIKSKQSSIPESVSPLIDVLLSLFQIMFEMSSNQNRELRQSIEKQTQTIDNQTQTIEKQTQTIDNQTQTIQTLIQELEKTRQEKLKNDEIIKTLKTLLKSKTVDLDSLKRLLFQGGREQKKDSTAKSDKTPKSENKKNSSQRNRQSNSEKTKDCDVSISNYITNDGKTLNAQNEEEASKEIPQEIEIEGQKFRFTGWKVSRITTEKIETTAKITSYVPVYEPIVDATLAKGSALPKQIEGFNPEKDFLPKTLIGFNLMSKMVEERMQNRLPMNRIANAFSKACSFNITRQQLARYFIFSAEWIQPAYEYLKEKVLSSRIIHLDESFIHCQEEDNNRQYVLVFTSDNGCFFHYTNSRSQTIPFSILQNHFDGDQWVDNNGDEVVISTDGWYDLEWLRDPNGNYKATLVGCMVHLRRYFWDVYNAHANHIDETCDDYIISKQVVNLLKFIFHKDKECQTVEERTQTRKFGEVRAKFDEIKKVIDETYNKMLECKNPSELYTSKFIKAVKYARNQWEKFSRIMEDGNIPLSNSEAERSIRDFAVLRHSTASGFASIKGAESVAVFSSFHETCKKFGVPLGKYLEFLFRNMGIYKHKVNNDNMSIEEKNKLLESSMPWNFKKV